MFDALVMVFSKCSNIVGKASFECGLPVMQRMSAEYAVLQCGQDSFAFTLLKECGHIQPKTTPECDLCDLISVRPRCILGTFTALLRPVCL